MIWAGMEDVKIVLLSKSARFCESRRKGNRTYCPGIYAFNLKNFIICKWNNSSDFKSFLSGSAFNPDSFICIKCGDSPWLFAVVGLCFVEDTFFYH
jgi:hypothetical protein